LEGVAFMVNDAESESDTVAQVREFLAGLQVAG
jgi:hypothetical protein